MSATRISQRPRPGDIEIRQRWIFRVSHLNAFFLVHSLVASSPASHSPNTTYCSTPDHSERFLVSVEISALDVLPIAPGNRRLKRAQQREKQSDSILRLDDDGEELPDRSLFRSLVELVDDCLTLDLLQFHRNRRRSVRSNDRSVLDVQQSRETDLSNITITMLLSNLMAECLTIAFDLNDDGW